MSGTALSTRVSSTTDPIAIDDAVLEVHKLEITASVSHPYLDHLSYTLHHQGVEGSSTFVLALREGKLVATLPPAFPAQGQWRLSITDSYNDEVWGVAPNTGVLEGWSISIEPEEGKSDGILGADWAGAAGQGESGGCSVSGFASSPPFCLLLFILVFLRRRR